MNLIATYRWRDQVQNEGLYIGPQALEVSRIFHLGRDGYITDGIFQPNEP